MHFFVKAIQTQRSNLVRTDISGITFINPPSNYNEMHPVSDLSICIVRLKPIASKSRGPLAAVSNIFGTFRHFIHMLPQCTEVYEQCFSKLFSNLDCRTLSIHPPRLYSTYFLIHSAVFLQSWGWEWGGESQLDSPRVFLHQNPARGVSLKR